MRAERHSSWECICVGGKVWYVCAGGRVCMLIVCVCVCRREGMVCVLMRECVCVGGRVCIWESMFCRRENMFGGGKVCRPLPGTEFSNLV